MVRMFVRHQVAEYDQWRKVYDSFDAERAPMGVKGDAVFQGVDDGNDVTVWHDFDTIEEARGFAQWPRLKEAMDEVGVTSAPDIWSGTKPSAPSALRNAAARGP